MSEVQPQPGDEDHLCRCAVTNPPCSHCTDCRECYPLEEKENDVTATAQPQPGDKVRVTYETVVRRDGTFLGSTIDYERCNVDQASHKVNVLERADDPSRDEIGTTAELDGVVWVKTELTVWREVGGDMRIGNPGMRDRTVTGAVPGTAAAQAQRENDVLVSRFRALREPAEARRDDQGAACGKYDPKGELGGVIYTTCLNCGFGAAAHGEVVGP